jgi:hypothetical protein
VPSSSGTAWRLLQLPGLASSYAPPIAAAFTTNACLSTRLLWFPSLLDANDLIHHHRNQQNPLSAPALASLLVLPSNRKPITLLSSTYTTFVHGHSSVSHYPFLPKLIGRCDPRLLIGSKRSALHQVYNSQLPPTPDTTQHKSSNLSPQSYKYNNTPHSQ